MTIKHGTVSGYSYHKCRCDQCRAASTEYRRKRRQRGINADSPITHGTLTGYDLGCRCDPCRHGKSVYLAEWRKRKGCTSRSNTLTTAAAAQPAVDVPALIEARARALAVTISQAPRSATARDARIRRSELLALLAKIRQATA